ncbi:MAG TPA: restriction endonuclease subunit S [Pyrinomonadaceae bacterium]|nr:restriction endonuclease subunit S [Pyrinomonadaceae bacterium]
MTNSQATPLGEILSRSTEIAEIQPDESYKEITVKLWGKGAVLRGITTGAELNGSRRFLARKGQLILSRIDARNGAIGLVPESLDGSVVSNDFPLFALNKNRILPGYFEWLGKTKPFVELCQKASEGTTNRVRLQEDRFLNLQILLPPLAEQRRIVARIEELADKINEARGLRQKAKEEAEAFVTSLNANLAGTRMKKLGDILRLDEDLAAVISTSSYPQVGVKSFGAGLFAKGAVVGSETTYKTFNRLYEGALVLSQVKGWEGAVAVCPAHLAGWFVSPEYRTFRCIEDQARPGYLAPLVRTQWFWGKLGRATRGVGARRERTRPEQFLNIDLPIPTIEKQAQGERFFAQVNSIMRCQADTAVAFEALLPSVLDKAFKSEF